MPSAAPASTSVIRSPPAEAIISLIVLPPGEVSSSSTSARVMVPLLSSVGASFTAPTVTEAVSPLELKLVPVPRLVASILTPSRPDEASQA